MNYDSKVIGHYSKSRRLARIYIKILNVDFYNEFFPNRLELVYEKNVTYRTYLKNLKRIIKENEIA
tara:strand:+ start:110 stop:307 length:198 start_codon:yes stop_codon:yes gene_type:complete